MPNSCSRPSSSARARPWLEPKQSLIHQFENKFPSNLKVTSPRSDSKFKIDETIKRKDIRYTKFIPNLRKEISPESFELRNIFLVPLTKEKRNFEISFERKIYSFL